MQWIFLNMIINDGFHSKYLFYEFYLILWIKIQIRSKNSNSAADESWVFELQ